MLRYTYIVCLVWTRLLTIFCLVDQNSSVGIAARRSGDQILVGGEIFLTRPDRFWGPPQPPVQWVPDLSRCVALTTRHHSAEVKERVELYLYFTFEPSWLVLG
jgi:hypothetical protein